MVSPVRLKLAQTIQLQKMLDGLSEFETYRGVVKDAQELLKQHEQTMKQTDEAADRPETRGKPLDALSPEQKADLSKLASSDTPTRNRSLPACPQAPT